MTQPYAQRHQMPCPHGVFASVVADETPLCRPCVEALYRMAMQ